MSKVMFALNTKLGSEFYLGKGQADVPGLDPRFAIEYVGDMKTLKKEELGVFGEDAELPSDCALYCINLDRKYEQVAYFSTLSSRLRHDLDLYMYNNTLAHTIGLKAITEYISPKSPLAPYIISPPAYIYAWYLMRKFAVWGIRVSDFSNPTELLDKMGVPEWKELYPTEVSYLGKFTTLRSEGYLHFPMASVLCNRAERGVRGWFGVKTMMVDAIVSYMLESWHAAADTPEGLVSQAKSRFLTPSKGMICEATKFDIWGWQNAFNDARLISDSCSRVLAGNAKSDLTNVVALAIFIVFAMYNPIIARGKDYTIGTKQIIKKVRMDADELDVFKNAIGELVQAIRFVDDSNHSDLQLDIDANMPILPDVKPSKWTVEEAKTMTRLNIEVSSEMFATKYRESFTLQNQRMMTNYATPSCGVTKGTMLMVALDNLGILNRIRGGDDCADIIMTHIASKINMLLAALTPDERDLVLSKLTIRVKQSTLTPKWAVVLDRVQTTLALQHQGGEEEIEG